MYLTTFNGGRNYVPVLRAARCIIAEGNVWIAGCYHVAERALECACGSQWSICANDGGTRLAYNFSYCLAALIEGRGGRAVVGRDR